MTTTEDGDSPQIEDVAEEVAEETAAPKAKAKKAAAKKAKGVVKPLSEDQLGEYNRAQERRGVVYLSRIPPGMPPQFVKTMLARHGEVLRVYLQPEDELKRKRRIKERGGGNGKNYDAGWVEFADKAVARRVVKELNCMPIGGHVRSKWAEDLWVMKYLPGFQWSDLTDKVAQENEMRQQRLRVAISRAKRENELFLEKVAVSKRIEHAKKKKAIVAALKEKKKSTTAAKSTKTQTD